MNFFYDLFYPMWLRAMVAWFKELIMPTWAVNLWWDFYYWGWSLPQWFQDLSLSIAMW
jgi:hypothetical protein